MYGNIYFIKNYVIRKLLDKYLFSFHPFSALTIFRHYKHETYNVKYSNIM